MQYVKITFAVSSQEMSDMLTAVLSDAGYEGFEEQDGKLLAYIAETEFDDGQLKILVGSGAQNYEREVVPSQNWNALWESNFEPVIVAGFCTIRAHFHHMEVTTPFDIVITPKMSFGTGHHATTQLMITMMGEMDLAGRSVLDFGTGTGVLAILAEKLGATAILAIDNDEWALENSREYSDLNHCRHVTIQAGSLEDVQMGKTDIILANINRHILLHYMAGLHEKLANGGAILMSGLLTEDRDAVLKAAASAGFRFKEGSGQAGWIALLFEKKA